MFLRGFAQEGHTVFGIDVDEKKVELINSGKATIIEEGLDSLISEGVNNGRITASTDWESAIQKSDVGIICVGTPNTNNGHLNVEHVYRVAEQIGNSLKKKNNFFTLTIRSTVTPGTNRYVKNLIEKLSGKKENIDFAVISNPEFLREGNAIEDFFNPPYTVIGGCSEKGINSVRELFSFTPTPIKVVDIQIAEMIKFLNNSYHALKVAFANEVGRICKSMNVDSYDLMELFVEDTQLNISKIYFKPGFSYGGSCLPKDLKALSLIAHDRYIQVPILRAIDNSNSLHSDYVFRLVECKNVKKIGIFGLSFKPSTDDLRFSPSLELCEKLIGKGYDVSIYDENISLSKLVGKNKDFLLKHLPHIDKLLKMNIIDFFGSCDLIVFVHNSNKILTNLKHIKEDTIIIDIAKISELAEMKFYEGVCW